MLAGIYRKEKIRLPVVGPHPSPIDSYPARDPAFVDDAAVLALDMQEIDQSLARFGLRHGVLLIVSSHIKFGVARAATCSRAGCPRLVFFRGGHIALRV